jgi:hypothetical protein
LIFKKLMQFYCSVVVVFSIPFSAYSEPANTFLLKLINESEVSTAYLDLHLREFQLPPEPNGLGGAILAHDNAIIFGSTSGTFNEIKTSTSTLSFKANYLPKLNTGNEQINSSKHITYREISPRVLDIIFSDGFFYVSYERYYPHEDVVKFIISKIKKSEPTWSDIYVSPSLDVSYLARGDGGTMAIRKEKLFFTVGDFSLDRINHLPSDVAAQRKGLPWGKINYIDLKENVFHYYSLGHRNPKGLVFLRDGRLLSSEHGPQGGDELNLIKKGRNYGWPYESYGTKYGDPSKSYKDFLPLSDKKFSLLESSTGSISNKIIYEPPMFSFVPSIAPSTLIQIDDFDKDWNGNLLQGSLKAMSLYHMKLIGDRVVYSEPIYFGKRIRDLAQQGKKLILITDSNTLIIATKILDSAPLKKEITSATN